jgi:regulatory protein
MKTKALNKMADYCSKAERCTDDVRRKLAHYELTDKERNEIIAWLTKERFIDDARFAQLYARDKARFNGWGPQKIRCQLIGKHIGSKIISMALDELNAEEQNDKLKSLLETKARSIKHDDPWKRRTQLIRFGLSRGFDYESVIRALPKDIPDTD